MNYTKHEFKTGDILYASQLNEMDDQIAKNEEALGKTILFTEQTLTEEQKAQARANIGVVLEEDDDGTITKEIIFSYDGDINSDTHTWINGTSGSKAFVKVGDIPNGKLNLIGGIVSVIDARNSSLNYSFVITDDMLEASVDHYGWIIPAKVNGMQQIYYQHTPSNDTSPIAVVLICTIPGRYAIGFNGWGEELQFAEKGIYFLEYREYGGNKFATSLVCTVTTSSEEPEKTPVEYDGNEIQMFTRGICIGDSITEGIFNHNDGEIGIKKYSYPYMLKRLTNVDITNSGVAGLTSKTWYNASLDSSTQWGSWLNNEWVWNEDPEAGESDIVSKTLDYSGYDFAIIHLGINDIGMMGSTTLEETIATFATNIGNIINKLKTESNGIKVFLCTIIPCYAPVGHTGYDTLNDKIREIANTTDDVYLIDLNQYSELYDGTPYENQHLTAVGYHKMANEIMSLINYTIHNNLPDFKWVQFIGTEYSG